jgi:hypothetical protein
MNSSSTKLVYVDAAGWTRLPIDATVTRRQHAEEGITSSRNVEHYAAAE